jgi:hypothetical protein
MAIALVSGNDRFTGTTGPAAGTLANTPIQGNILIATISANITTQYVTVTGITQTNVTWSEAVQANAAYTLKCAIWFGVVGANASKNVSVGFNQNCNGIVVNITEWGGILTVNPVDKTAANPYGSTSTATSTGTTAATTQANELWVGCICAYLQSQATPTNGFTLLDGSYTDGQEISDGHLYKIASTTGTANTGTTITSSYNHGCIATFKGTSGQQLFTLINEMNY